MICKPLAALAFAAALAAPVQAQQAAPAAPVTIRLVQTNDIDRMGESKGRGGFARFAAVVKAERQRGNAVVVHAGDTLSPSLLSGFDKGAHIIDLLNRIGLDVFTPGNHEFDFGPQNFRERMAEATFDVVASNLAEPDGTAPANAKPHKLMEIGGVKLAFFGLTTEDTRNVSSPGEIVIRPSVETARDKVRELREAGADLVVAVAHTPLAVDMMLARMAGIDVVLGGHDEHLLTFYNGRTVLTESQSQANYVVVTELAVTKTQQGGKTSVAWTPNFRVIDSAGVEPDPEIAAVVKDYEGRLDAELNVPVGVSETPLDSRRAVVRGGEAAIGNLIADAMRAAVGAEVAITNGGGLRADRQYPAGVTLTRRDILSELPFGNKTVLLEIRGDQLKAALENGFSQAREVAGRFPQVSGMVVEADLAQPVGSRVTRVSVGGAPLDPARLYRLATNDFMARGGDGYRALVDARRLLDEEASQIMATQVIEAIAKAGRISPKVEGRIVIR